MILDAIFAFLFVLLVGCILYTMFHKLWHKEPVKGEARVAKMEASVNAPDKWIFVKHRGMVLPMREHEKRELWDNMTRMARNEQVAQMKKAIKQRRVTCINISSDVVVFAPNHLDLIKLEADYKEAARLGKIVISEV